MFIDIPTTFLGFHGDWCEKRVADLCEVSPCANNASCSGNDGNYTCICPRGYSGSHCEVDINNCEATPCKNGVCVDELGGHKCYCTPGMYIHKCYCTPGKHTSATVPQVCKHISAAVPQVCKHISATVPQVCKHISDGDGAVMAQWLGCRTSNHKVASSSPVTAMSSFGDWFTQPQLST